MMKLLFISLVLFATSAKAQTTKALPDEAWNVSEWICVADAPEIQGRVDDATRAADGANWFFT